MRRYFLFCLFFIPWLAFSGVIPEKSRIVFNGKNTVQSYVLVNTNKYPVIVQLWVDDGEFNAHPELTPSPFFITPAMLKMDSLKINEMKVLYSGEDFKLPQDRESLFWLNILEIPPTNKDRPSENEIALSMLTQIKLIYRPVNIEINAIKLIEKFNSLTFSLKRNSNRSLDLTINNPTEYIASLSNVTLTGKDNNKPVAITSSDMSNLTLLPKSSKTLNIAFTNQSSSIQDIEYLLIDDQGKFLSRKKKLTFVN